MHILHSEKYSIKFICINKCIEHLTLPLWSRVTSIVTRYRDREIFHICQCEMRERDREREEINAIAHSLHLWHILYYVINCEKERERSCPIATLFAVLLICLFTVSVHHSSKINLIECNQNKAFNDEQIVH